MPSTREASAALRCPVTMDSAPATVPSVTASPGDPELLGPLSVLYAALIARLLEVTAPHPQLWLAGGRVLSGVGALTGRRRNKVCVRPEAAGLPGAV